MPVTTNRGRLEALRRGVAPFAHAIGAGDEARIVELLLQHSRDHRALAPFTFAFGGLAMLLAGLRVLLRNWQLMLVQVLPAMWVWIAMYDLRLHLLKGGTASGLRGPILLPIGLAIVAGTIASYFLNAVFAFAVAQEGGRPDIRRAVGEARGRLRPIAIWGGVVGVALAVTTTVVTRAEPPWFVLSLGIVVGVLMVTYVSVPARMLGVSDRHSPRDRLAAAAFGALIGVLVSAPPYLISRIGILMLGSPVLFAPGLVLLTVGAVMQAGATGAVKAVKVSARLG